LTKWSLKDNQPTKTNYTNKTTVPSLRPTEKKSNLSKFPYILENSTDTKKNSNKSISGKNQS
jgi:hypothetical protein